MHYFFLVCCPVNAWPILKVTLPLEMITH
uniref:Uncharacterized protein n=1 Tax=Anguilla anguilla TaxID=7936 RepID=A0A0E9VGA5_ANGAN